MITSDDVFLFIRVVNSTK